MLIKIITCKVRDDSKERFHYAQTKWAELNRVNGFIAQVGGWNMVNTNEAVMIAIWETLEQYSLFMSEIHDHIIAKNEQTSSYEDIEVSLWKTDRVVKHNEIISYKYLSLEHIQKNSHIVDRWDDNSIWISPVKNATARKRLLFHNDLEHVEGNQEVLVMLDEAWTVSS